MTMDIQEFVGFLESEPDHFELAVGPHEGRNGIFVKNKTFETQTHFTDEVIGKMELRDLVVATHHGRNIEQMTRVTGYFSKIDGWNKGKVGELKERNRVGEL